MPRCFYVKVTNTNQCPYHVEDWLRPTCTEVNTPCPEGTSFPKKCPLLNVPKDATPKPIKCNVKGQDSPPLG